MVPLGVQDVRFGHAVDRPLLHVGGMLERVAHTDHSPRLLESPAVDADGNGGQEDGAVGKPRARPVLLRELVASIENVVPCAERVGRVGEAEEGPLPVAAADLARVLQALPYGRGSVLVTVANAQRPT